MLIVNADDFGRSKIATDAAMSCYAKGRISSTSAMVFMEDSERAAELALSSGIEVGLHLNLSEAFSAVSVPAGLRDVHDQVCRFLNWSKYALLIYHPLMAAGFRYAFQAQHEEFVRLYGRPPSHFDGHQHMHLGSNMLIQCILPKGSTVRGNFSFRPGEKSLLNRWYRSAVDRWLKRRHHLSDYFFSLSQCRAPQRFENVIGLAAQANVELMTHPELADEFEFLMSDVYGEALGRVWLRGHDAL